MRKSIAAALVFVGCGAQLAGCAAALGGDGDDDELDPALSPIGVSVVTALREKHAATDGRAWNVTSDDSFAPGWILQTPPAEFWGQPASALPVATDCSGDAACDPDFHLIRCATQADCRFGGRCSEVAATVTKPGEPARKLCTGHSDGFFDDIYKLVTSAQSFVDLASLEPPDGRFEVAVRNAITFLSHATQPVRVRLLYGAVPARARGTSEVLAALVRDVAPASPIKVGVGMYRSTLLSWNHTKLIAVDGRTAIVGGHNMWTDHYLQHAPVRDISMRVSGSAAADASAFVNQLWVLACHPPPAIGSVGSVSDFPAGAKVCSDAFTVADDSVESGSVPVITAGKLGGIDGDAGQDAIIALLDAAQTKLRLSLQDIGPVGGSGAWPDPYLAAIDRALARGVEIELVLSNLNALPGGLMVGSASYSNGWTPIDVAKKLIEYADAHPEVGGNIRDAVCTKLHATTLRQGADDKWQNGAGMANHAKLVIADDAAFYIGSQNWYPAQLSELGYIVDDAATTRQLLDEYFLKMWSASSRVMANTCGL
jgi:phosphatidylserine/phosphatidylglycerophosphate/cardiolipin synthase-like enzyme